MEDVETRQFDRPGHSISDMNFNEHVSDKYGGRIQKYTPISKITTELRKIPLQEWNKIDKNVVKVCHLDFKLSSKKEEKIRDITVNFFVVMLALYLY